MGRPCSVCGHPQRTAIDAALVAGNDPFRIIANRFGTSTGSLQRHKADHLPLVMAEAERRAETKRIDTASAIVSEQAERTDTYQ